ncbi:formin-like protein 3 [Schistocerca serialis cubense]|uniref:formin-like protein 3 n=1 Tax=Schistocerca serialis cubense TaxID=2023355 RepID=UPI00214F52A5|nr:formin-like protein 3 [Schistocerca serialis cubense]
MYLVLGASGEVRRHLNQLRLCRRTGSATPRLLSATVPSGQRPGDPSTGSPHPQVLPTMPSILPHGDVPPQPQPPPLPPVLPPAPPAFDACRLLMQSVCIVGAGAAGLCAARLLSPTPHFKVVVFEQSAMLSGTWRYNDDPTVDPHSRMYCNLRMSVATRT